MKQLNFLFIIIFFSLITQSCRKDIDDIERTPPNIPSVSKVISSLHGTVVDDLGNIVSGASVIFDGETAETDENGVFQFVNKEMNENGTFVLVEKEGFFKGSRRLYPSVGNTNIVNIELITLEISGEFNSTSSATIVNDGVSLDFPKDGIMKKDGSIFTGNVNVAVAYLDPTNPNTLDQMPGDLTGISSDDGLVALKSLGMIAVELLDDNGAPLQVKEGKLVDVTIPIPNDLQADAPATIPMWHFDEEMGIWIEEGFADLVGDHYEASLAHFSFWNCDIPSDFVFMKGSILNRNIPIQGVTVMILDSDNNTSGYGVTDENGMFCGYIPDNAELTLVVYNQCGVEIYTTIITTTDADVSLDPINLNLLVDYASISGSATYCDGDLSEFAYVEVQHGGETFTFPISEDNTFIGNIFYCNPGDVIAVYAFDPIIGIVSGEYNFTVSGDLEVGNIDVCNEAFVEHLILEYGDVTLNVPFDEDWYFILNYVEGNLLDNDTPGYILKTLLTGENDTILNLIKFKILHLEGSPFQVSEIEVIDGGFVGFGLCSSQVVTQGGAEYLKVSGDLPFTRILEFVEDNYDESYTSVYFDLLIEI